ncbi:thioredoxin domain-containing protein [Brevundimonas aurifodinae]|uniref:Thioredoxin domain-containing protein n=2 Tax=Brevundimonas TaxID=41275 RepID=A0ABV1NRZ1_9CAUL|nr:MAG: thioredoxin [Brevundimonas sp. 12-68-7]OYX33939.1 MAG: thioredoxin [Brevundimonas subvibrioides]
MRADGRFKFSSMSRRAAVTGAALAAMAVLAGCSGSTAGNPADGDMAKGAPEGAKVTVIEYASVTCGACAAWQSQVWPEFKTKYVDTNQVRFVFREFPTPPQPVAVAGFLMARCAGPENYFPVVEELLASQAEMFGPAGPRPLLLRVANGVGLSEEQFQACVTDEAAIAAMDERIKAAMDAGVSGTPTFIVNGQTVPDNSLSGLSAAIDAALAEG